MPTVKKRPSAQIINYGNKYYLVDCGEGTQVQLRKQKISLLKINHIFISHLHGDHYFGLIGLVNSMHLLGRTKELHLYAPKGMKEIINVQLNAANARLNYKIHHHELTDKASVCIYDEKGFEVHTVPLKHRIYTNGFLFKEKPLPRKMKQEKIAAYQIPHYKINEIKEGADFIDEEGEVVPNEHLTFPAEPSLSYAYCSDTAYKEDVATIIQGVNAVYHEATFLESEKDLAKKTFHSTVKQTATIASKSKAKALYIGHFSARYNTEHYPQFLKEAKEIFENTLIANEGDIIKLR